MAKRGEHGKLIGDVTREAVYKVMQEKPNATQAQLSALTGYSVKTVTKARQAVRLGWTPAMRGK